MSSIEAVRERISELGVVALIVDDDEFMHDVMMSALRKVGFTDVLAVDNGADGLAAVDRYSDTSVLIAFVDLNMPDMDGVELIRHLSERDFQGSLVPISGEDKKILKSVEDLARQRQLRVLAALQKPVSINALAEAVSSVSLTRRTEGQRDSGEQVVTAHDLKKALALREIFPVFQPKVDIQSGTVVGVEALARWIRDDGELVRPDIFIPVAESHGLINALTERMFEASLYALAEWQRIGIDVHMSVNVSVQTLNQMDVSKFDLPSFLVSRAGEVGVKSDKLIIEVTESKLMEDLAGPLDVMTRLRLKGFGLSIDDFGTGYSTMKQLVRVPALEMKIDKMFVAGARDDKANFAILKSSIQLAKSLDMQAVAEGVETQEEWDMVAELGADIVQGYFVSKPMKSDEFVAWHQSWQDK